jgi:hypothetical protein
MIVILLAFIYSDPNASVGELCDTDFAQPDPPPNEDGEDNDDQDTVCVSRVIQVMSDLGGWGEGL